MKQGVGCGSGIGIGRALLLEEKKFDIETKRINDAANEWNIFCSARAEFENRTRKMLEGCYIANTPEEAYGYLEQLKNGIDPLKEKRKHLIKEVFGKDLGQASAKIVEKMAK